MKILVCISNVPDTTSKINFAENNTLLDTKGIQFIINPHDEYMLTRAMWFKEKQGATVTVVNVGKATSEPTLRKALAIGADDAIRVDAEATDSWSVAKELAEVIKTGEFDLVLTGKESIDYNGNMVPGMVAELVNYHFVNACNHLEIEGNSVTAHREINGGKEVLTTELPAVIAGQKGIVEEADLHIPNMRGIMMARKKPLKVIPSTETKPATRNASYEKPAPKAACKIAKNVDELVDLLRNEAKVIQ